MRKVGIFAASASFLVGLKASRGRGFATALLTGLAASSSACSGAPGPAVAAPSDVAPASTLAQSGAPSGQAAESSPAAAGAQTAESGTTAGPSAPPSSTLASGDSREDAQWVQADDYFVAARAFDKGWQNVDLAKMKEPPAGAEREALFFVIKDGHEQRSAHFYRSRPATQSDLALGNLLICFDDNKRGGVYGAPRDKDNARPGGWWLARITDLSDLAKGYATLSGSYHCAPGALRAILK